MKTLLIQKNIKYLTLLAIIPFSFTGCDGGGTNWGVDNDTQIEVSHGPLVQATGKYRCDLSDAMLVESGKIVTPLSEDTEIRVWHFQNSEEYVCILKGQAIITQLTRGV